MMVLRAGIDRYFDQDQDLHPSDFLSILELYNDTKGDRSCLIGALVSHLRSATPLDDPAPLRFTADLIGSADNYWEAYDFSDRGPCTKLERELAPFTDGFPESLAELVQSRIDSLLVSDAEKASAELQSFRDQHEEHLARLHDRERRLLEDPIRHRSELIRVRARCNAAELPFPDFDREVELSHVEPNAGPFNLPNAARS
jgi:hypothetical protein